MTVFDRWLSKTNPTGELPPVSLPGVGSDYGPFMHLSGVPSLDMGFRQNTRNAGLYSTYHTAYDTYDYIAKFVDPGFIGKNPSRP